MVKTGARALALGELVAQIGISVGGPAPPVPRLATLPAAWAARILGLFRALGGTVDAPVLRPGAWDLACTGGTVFELDEELHFNRYRRLTLEPDWMGPLPWRDAYLGLTREREADCLEGAKWGRRWTNPSAERLFGPADPPGQLAGAGAPRWKQRALYDAMKDVAALTSPGFRLVRLATHDDVGGVRLGNVLRGRATADLPALRRLVDMRST